MAFHLIHPSIHTDLASITNELADITAFMAYAVENDNWTGDTDARAGAMLLLSAMSASLKDLGAVEKEEAGKAFAKAYGLGFMEGQRDRTPAQEMAPAAEAQPKKPAKAPPDLTEPAPPAKRQARTG